MIIKELAQEYRNKRIAEQTAMQQFNIELEYIKLNAKPGYCHKTALVHHSLWADIPVDHKTGEPQRISRKVDINNIQFKSRAYPKT